MHLIIPDHDISKCYLTEVGAGAGSYAGAIIRLPPLDILCGDILSFSFETDSDGGMTPHRDEYWDMAVSCFAEYENICLFSHDAEVMADDCKDSDTTLCIVENFLDLPDKLKTYRNLDLYLVAAKKRKPLPDRRIVPCGFTSEENPKKESISAHFALAESRHDIKKYLSLWEEYKGLVSIEAIYDIQGFADLALVSALEVLDSGKTLTRCEKCGRFFSPSRDGEKYCSRIAPGSKKQTCKERAKYEKQLERERSSESGKIYRSRYNVLRAKYINEANEAEREKNRIVLDDFMSAAATFRKEIKRGTKTEAEYIQFLNSFKKRGKK